MALASSGFLKRRGRNRPPEFSKFLILLSKKPILKFFFHFHQRRVLRLVFFFFTIFNYKILEWAPWRLNFFSCSQSALSYFVSFLPQKLWVIFSNFDNWIIQLKFQIPITQKNGINAATFEIFPRQLRSPYDMVVLTEKREKPLTGYGWEQCEFSPMSCLLRRRRAIV